ncbi:uncharacterized protein [Asterias amurensis]|uniref:uncharacterized protein n=1 Tax=Asterias amurensis TaxID=7602 RepID=UPI003AB73A3A
MELLTLIEWILLQFILLEKFSLGKGSTPMCETCPVEHPQQHFCNSDFVIQGKILRRENFITPPIKRTRIITAPSAEPSVSTSTTKQQSSVNALSWQPLREGKVFKALRGTHLTDETEDGGRDQVPASEAVIRYRVLVSKIYKGSKWIRIQDVVDIDSVHNEEVCRSTTTHHLTQETLLISGTFKNGRLVHHPCDWSVILGQISLEVHRQLTHVYHRHCLVCTIETATSGRFGIQQAMTDSSGCFYKPSFYTDKGLIDCEGLYAACKKIQHGCSWSENHRMRDCIRKRETQFSSPSILESRASTIRHADLKASVNLTKNVSEIPTMLLKDDKEDAESQKASKQELNHTLQAEGRKQDVTPTLTTQREQGFLNLPDHPEKVAPSYQTDEELNHTHQQEVQADGTKQDLLPTLTTQREQTFLTLQQELRAEGTKEDKTPHLTTQREQTFLNLPDRPETESPSYWTDLFVTMQSDHSSKTFGEVSSSHTAMPHYAFDLPQPHVSSKDAADILEKIAQRHLQNRKV